MPSFAAQLHNKICWKVASAGSLDFTNKEIQRKFSLKLISVQ
jgi:hypothetical protein